MSMREKINKLFNKLKTGESDMQNYIMEDVYRLADTTSKSEAINNAKHYTMVTTVENILPINIRENLRIGYSNVNSAKNVTAVHKDLISSFATDKQRFIQKHSGFTILCEGLDSPAKYKVSLKNPSLINGAQTQQLLADYIHNHPDDTDALNTEIRVEVIIERSKKERVGIAIAKNNSVNVSNLSKLGKQKYFDGLERGLQSALGPTARIKKSETDKAIDTEVLVQVTKTFIPHKYNKKLLESPQSTYIQKKGNLTEYKRLSDEKNIQIKFYEDFAGIAWNEYLTWSRMDYWLKVRSRSKNFHNIGTYNERNKSIVIKLGVMLPLLYGLKCFVKPHKDAWALVYPRNFNAKDYIKHISNLYRKKDFDPHQFGRDKDNYLDLLVHVQSLYETR